METISKLLKGKKTFIGIAALALGAFGAAQYISAGELSSLFDAVLKIAGIIIAVYGRISASK